MVGMVGQESGRVAIASRGLAQGSARDSGTPAGADAALLRLAARLGGMLAERDARISTAESCTGGWIGQALTQVPGSSAWFHAGYITYSNDAKQRTLGVPGAVLLGHGAVSEETVVAMAAGVLACEPGADLAVAVSGVAGPGGGSEINPVGTVWLAWQLRLQPPLTRRCVFRGDRWRVRRATVATALAQAARLLAQTPAPASTPTST